MSFVDYANYQATYYNKDPEFKPLPLPMYVIRYWVPYMADKAANLIEDGAKTRLDIVAALYLSGAVVGTIVLLIRIRLILVRPEFIVISIAVLGYVAALILQEYGVYLEYGIPGAIRTRYLVPILPLLFCMLLYVVWPWSSKHKLPTTFAALVVLLALSQGGGVVTHLFTTPPHAYWTPSIYKSNQTAKVLLDPVVYDD